MNNKKTINIDEVMRRDIKQSEKFFKNGGKIILQTNEGDVEFSNKKSKEKIKFPPLKDVIKEFKKELEKED